MTGLDRLNSKLAKLKGTDESEQIVSGATDGIIAALLAEIEETILPREMVLTDENGTRFVLVVAGRRLLQVTDPGAPAAALAGAAGDDPAERIVAAFNGPFRAFLDQAREIGIDAHRPHGRIDPTEIGCSVDTLARAVAGGPEPAQAAEADPLAEALALASAGLRVSGGEIVARSGAPPLIARLEAFAASDAALARVTAGDAAAPVCTILGTSDPDGMMLARVALRGDTALLLAPAGARPALIALCRQPFPAATHS